MGSWEGGYNFYFKIFWGGSVLKHYTFLKTTAPPKGWHITKLIILKTTYSYNYSEVKIAWGEQVREKAESRCEEVNGLARWWR